MKIHKLSCLTLALALLAGCASTPQGSGISSVITPERVQSVTKLGVYVFAVEDLKQHPEHREQFEHSRQGLDALVAQERWDAEAMSIALAQSGETFSGSEGALMLNGGPLLLDAFTGGKLDLSQQIYARAAITGAEQGLTLALGPRPRGLQDPHLDNLTAAAVATRKK